MTPAAPQRQLRAVAAFEKVSTIAGMSSATIGVLVLIGWWRDINALRTIIPGLIATIPNTAVAVIIGGLALVSAVREARDPRLHIATRALALILTALGTLFFIERLFEINLGIDLLLFGDAVKLS